MNVAGVHTVCHFRVKQEKNVIKTNIASNKTGNFNLMKTYSSLQCLMITRLTSH